MTDLSEEFWRGILTGQRRRPEAMSDTERYLARTAMLQLLGPNLRAWYETYEIYVLRQLLKGKATHGEKSFDLSDERIEREKIEETIDADTGWSFPQFVRRMRDLGVATKGART